MVLRAFHLSSTWEFLLTDHVKVMFTNFKYSDSLINYTISNFVTSGPQRSAAILICQLNFLPANRLFTSGIAI